MAIINSTIFGGSKYIKVNTIATKVNGNTQAVVSYNNPFSKSIARITVTGNQYGAECYNDDKYVTGVLYNSSARATAQDKAKALTNFKIADAEYMVSKFCLYYQYGLSDDETPVTLEIWEAE